MKCFEKILVPVDFSINTNVAVKKAIDFAIPEFTEIHLLHVSESKKFMNLAGIVNTISNSTATTQADYLLNQLVWEIQNTHKNIKTVTQIRSGKNIQSEIINTSRHLKPDLIIIGKKNQHSLLPFLNTVISEHLAAATDCPVLTVKPGSLNKKIETVVMPVCNSFPDKKMDVLCALDNKALVNVHLLTILNNDEIPDNHSASALLQSMKSIKKRINCNVQHCTIHSNNKAVATLRYAEKVKADILLISSKTEKNSPTWINRKELTDIVNPASHLQVINVHTH